MTTIKLLWNVYRIMSINESFVLSATTMGGGDFFVAVLIEYALKKVIKILAVIVGYFHLHEHNYNINNSI